MKAGIIGGGITGLTAALELKKRHPGAEVTIIEKDDTCGGLFANTAHDGYNWDHGVFFFEHDFHLLARYPDIFYGLEDYYRKVWQSGNIFNFPFSFYDTVLKNPPHKLLNLVIRYLLANTRCYIGPKPRDLQQWLTYRFSAPLLEITRLPVYFGKLQGLTPEELSPLFGDLRFKNIHRITRPWNIVNILMSNILRLKKKQERTIYYPDGDHGIRRIVDILEKEAVNAGVSIKKGCAAGAIEKTGAGYTVGTSDNSSRDFSHVVSTLPINDLVELRKKDFSPDQLETARGLDFLRMTVVFLLVDQDTVMHRNLVLYSFEKKHQWKRLCTRSVQDGKTAIVLEIPYLPTAEPPDEAAVSQCISQLTDDLGLFSKNDILYRGQTDIRHAYPIYRKGFEKKREMIKQVLQSDTFQLAGRQGDFIYANTDGAIVSACQAAASLG